MSRTLLPLTVSQFLSTSETVGLPIAHSVEIAGENIIFGSILSVHSRLPMENSDVGVSLPNRQGTLNNKQKSAWEVN